MIYAPFALLTREIKPIALCAVMILGLAGMCHAGSITYGLVGPGTTIGADGTVDTGGTITTDGRIGDLDWQDIGWWQYGPFIGPEIIYSPYPGFYVGIWAEAQDIIATPSTLTVGPDGFLGLWVYNYADGGDAPILQDSLQYVPGDLVGADGISSTPEPSAWLLLAVGIMSVGAAYRRMR
jgi:hypothetical protein